MESWKLILVVILIIVIGFLLYKLLPFNYTPNVVPFWNSNYQELNLIEKELDNKDTTEDRRQELFKRQQEIKDILNKFFGNELV